MDPYFDTGKGKENDFVVEANVSILVRWFVLPSSPEDRLNSFVFRLAILFVKGKRLVLVPLYLGSLFDPLDECVGNTVQFAGNYGVVTHEDTSFLQMFLWERFMAILSKPHEFHQWNWWRR